MSSRSQNKFYKFQRQNAIKSKTHNHDEVVSDCLNSHLKMDDTKSN